MTSQTADDGTWAYQWPAGARLARDFATIVSCVGLAVCDLGCGAGALGRAALAGGARSVTFADGNPAALASVHAALGAMADDARIEFHPHRWGEPLPGAPYDLILGGDILYRPECFADLLTSIAHGLGEHGRCLLSDPRKVLEPELPMFAEERALTWTTRRMKDYTLVGIAKKMGEEKTEG